MAGVGSGRKGAVRGVLLGWAFLVLAAGTIGYVALWIVWPVFGIGAAAIAILYWTQRRGGRGISLLLAKPSPLDVSLLLVLLIAGAARFAMARAHDLPAGWDPTFHLILIRKCSAPAWCPTGDRLRTCR